MFFGESRASVTCLLGDGAGCPLDKVSSSFTLSCATKGVVDVLAGNAMEQGVQLDKVQFLDKVWHARLAQRQVPGVLGQV